jgi:Cu-processing system permease protein
VATLIIARLTFLEAVRRRILLSGFVLGVVFLALYAAGFYFMFRSAGPAVVMNATTVTTAMQSGLASFLSLAGLYAVNFLAVAMGALISADSIAGEIASGAIQAIVTKPIRRAQVILGKWLGLAWLLALYLVLMAGGVMAVAFVISGYTSPNAATGLALIYFEALLIMSITLACSSTLSALATGGVIFGLYGVAFIGGWLEQFGSFLQNQTAINIGIISSLIMPSEALWRRASSEMMPAIAQLVGAAAAGPFFTVSVPSPFMVVYAGFYLVAAVGFAAWRFGSRDL